MKLIILAFILSLILHLLIFSPYKKNQEIKDKPTTSKEIKKSSVKYVRILKKDLPKQVEKVKPKKQSKKEKIKKTKLKTFTKVEKKKIVPQKKVRVVKKAKKIVPKAKKRTEIKQAFIPKKVQIKPQEKRKTIPRKSLENFLLAEPVPLDKSMLDNITRSYLNLYGEEYNSFTKVQKVYIQNNIKNIVAITERYFTFPEIALRKKLKDYNVVEFMFYPNGNISDLRIITKGDYAVYDKAILEAIEFAYKDFPRPKTATKIRFYLRYIVY